MKLFVKQVKPISNQMVKKLLKVFSKETISSESDLTPKGVAKTVADQCTDFNTTFQHMRQERMKLYGK